MEDLRADRFSITFVELLIALFAPVLPPSWGRIDNRQKLNQPCSLSNQSRTAELIRMRTPYFSTIYVLQQLATGQTGFVSQAGQIEPVRQCGRFPHAQHQPSGLAVSHIGQRARGVRWPDLAWRRRPLRLTVWDRAHPRSADRPRRPPRKPDHSPQSGRARGRGWRGSG